MTSSSWSLRTFALPDSVEGTRRDVRLAHEMVDAWRVDGIFQISVENAGAVRDAFAQSARFFAMPAEWKSACVSDLTYAGYIASGEEVTAGESDYSEIFTVCPDVPLDDPRVRD